MEDVKEFSVEDFMNEDLSELPEPVRKDLDGGKVGYSYKEIIAKHTTDAGRKLIGNMRGALTKSQQDAAELRRLLAEKDNELLAERKKVLSDYDRVKAVADENIDDLDLYEDGNLSKAVDVKVARLQKQTLDERRKELEQQEVMLHAKKILQENPELRDPEFNKLFMELGKQKPHLNGEELLLLTKGKLVQSAAAREEAARLAKHEQTVDKKKSLNSTSINGMSVQAKRPPKGLSGIQVYKWLQANPDAVQ